jgi:hypothetical protein
MTISQSDSLDALTGKLEGEGAKEGQPQTKAENGSGEPSAPETQSQDATPKAQDEPPVAEGIDDADAAEQRELRVQGLYRQIDGCQSSETVDVVIADAEKESSYLGYTRVEHVRTHGKKRKRFLAGDGTSSPTTRPPSQASLIDQYGEKLDLAGSPERVQEHLGKAEVDTRLHDAARKAINEHGKERMAAQEADRA